MPRHDKNHEEKWLAMIAGDAELPALFFPRDRASDPGVRRGPGRLPRPSGALQSVLVVDDDEALRRQITFLLEDEGYHVKAVGSGEAALALCAESHFDIVILDVHLPGISGLQVFEAMSGERRTRRFVIVSGFLHDSEIEAVERDGAFFLCKPVDGDELVKLLARIDSEPR